MNHNSHTPLYVFVCSNFVPFYPPAVILAKLHPVEDAWSTVYQLRLRHE